MSELTLPQGEELTALLGVPPESLDGYLETSLHAPLTEFLSRPGKAVRGQMVEIGFEIGSAAEPRAVERAACEGLASCVEAIHAGSLIIDDIEDNGVIRRGAPALHRRHGVPIALNAGNWLYFLGIHRCLGLGLKPGIERTCLSLLSRTMLRAHYGQALDVGIPIDEVPQSEVHDLCMTAIRLKSGALVALALTLGAAAAGANAACLEWVEKFGERFGIALQLFDDLRNLQKQDPSDPSDLKRLEDLYGRRPSWVWARAARECEPRHYQDFVRAARMLPDESFLTAWLGFHEFQAKAREGALKHLEETLSLFDAGPPSGRIPPRTAANLRVLATTISGQPL